MNNKEICQGDVYIVSFKGTIGSEQSLKGRPCLIIQNNIGNKHSGTTIIVPLTKRIKKYIPTHYILKKEKYPFLLFDSLVLGEQIRCVDVNSRILERKIGTINQEDLEKIISIICDNLKRKDDINECRYIY